MAKVDEGRPLSGKRVVVLAILLTLLFTIGMGYGTYHFAQWLTPILKERAEKQQAADKAEAQLKN